MIQDVLLDEGAGRISQRTVTNWTNRRIVPHYLDSLRIESWRLCLSQKLRKIFRNGGTRPRPKGTHAARTGGKSCTAEMTIERALLPVIPAGQLVFARRVIDIAAAGIGRSNVRRETDGFVVIGNR